MRWGLRTGSIMRDQLDDGAHLHPPHPSYAPIHPVLAVENTKGEHVSALLLQAASTSKKNREGN